VIDPGPANVLRTARSDEPELPNGAQFDGNRDSQGLLSFVVGGDVNRVIGMACQARCAEVPSAAQ